MRHWRSMESLRQEIIIKHVIRQQVVVVVLLQRAKSAGKDACFHVVRSVVRMRLLTTANNFHNNNHFSSAQLQCHLHTHTTLLHTYICKYANIEASHTFRTPLQYALHCALSARESHLECENFCLHKSCETLQVNNFYYDFHGMGKNVYNTECCIRNNVPGVYKYACVYVRLSAR